MGRDSIPENVKRRLYAECMGRCMNPTCQRELFIVDGDIIEKAHIRPYSEDADNSFENLVMVCPSCHKEFDKIHLYSVEQVKEWKRIRKNELESVFCRRFSSFEELQQKVVPLLFENKTIYENYYLGDEKELWDRFEANILINNKKLKMYFEHNLHLIQSHSNKIFSNLEYIYAFMRHVDEFEVTRADEIKTRKVLFPAEINSIFGVSPINGHMLPSTESLEKLIKKLAEKGIFETIILGDDNPYIQLNGNEGFSKIYLHDTPRIRQLYNDNDCFSAVGVRLESLNFALKYIKSKNIYFDFIEYDNLREIMIGNIKMVFVYEYCLSKADLFHLLPDEGTVIVNLHNWNGHLCISNEARELSNDMKVKVLSMEEFYIYVKQIRYN